MEYSVIAGSGEVAAEHCLNFCRTELVGGHTLSFESKCYTVQRNGRDYLRIEVNDDSWNPFNKWTFWRGFFCLGTGGDIIAVDLCSLEHKQYKVDGYFDHFKEYGEMLFAVSCTGVLAFDAEMDLLWRQEGLADDGVCVLDVGDDVLRISCQFDPPDGFTAEKRLDIRTGREL